MGWGATFGVIGTPTYAEQCRKSFLGFQAWYDGIEFTSCSGENSALDTTKYKDGDGMARLIWTIVMNVLIDISVAAGILTTGFIMYGGYLYIFSGGSPDKVAKGKTTIRNALIGLVIAVAAGVIIGTAKTILTA
ncbi:MAG: hypothetical protein HUJ63_11205 [Enterococcus sp.]|nr:hypothetical protein [Enterococcus sp.]